MKGTKRILFLCDASDIDVVEQSFRDHDEYELTIETTEKILSFGVKEYLSQTIQILNHHPDLYDGVVGTHDSSSVFAAVIAQETGKRFAPVKGVINSQNKYMCRQIQKQTIPEYTPAFCLALDYLRDPSQLDTPFFIKPVRSNISFGTHKIDSPEQLEYYIGQESMDIALFNQYYLDALAYNSSYHNALNITSCNSFLCEEFIQGDQVTVDGYIYNGHVCFFGITKAVYYTRTNSFSHHEFPFAFSESLEKIIKDSLSRVIPALGIDNSFFNVELRANEETKHFSIIEVNSRIAFQFAKTIESVTGINPLVMLCDMAVGKRPDQQSCRTESLFRHCYNFELHNFSDARILQTPTQIAYTEIEMKYPEITVRNLVHENTNLSDFKHNPESFRYCIIDIPGNNHEEIMMKYREVVSMLGYKFDIPAEETRHSPEAPARPPEKVKGGKRKYENQPAS